MLKTIYKDLRRAWDATPGLMKYVIVFAVLLNASSLASLSDNIIKWKGFIKAGIEFYRAVLAPLVTMIENLLAIDIPQWRVDFLVAYYIIMLTDLRSLKMIYAISDDPKWYNAIYSVCAYFLVPLGFLLGLNIFLEYGLLTVLALLLLLHIAFPIATLVAMAMDERRGIKIEAGDIHFKDGSVMFLVSLASAVLLVCCAAAINTGLRA